MTIDYVIGDCIEVLKGYPTSHFDSCVTDPPYGIRFMGAAWDGEDIQQEAMRRERLGPTVSRSASGRTSVGFGLSDAAGLYDFSLKGNAAYQRWSAMWAAEVCRVLKPGAHLLAMGGTRTSHRLACALEDAGFEIRDTLMWLYGSGFPKSLDVSKAIDRMKGAEREVIGRHIQSKQKRKPASSLNVSKDLEKGSKTIGWQHDLTTPATPEAAQWQGWGTALKPAYEPIILARKPLESTVAQNVLRHGTGGMNIDASRVGVPIKQREGGWHHDHIINDDGWIGREQDPKNPQGRWPANIILSHHPQCIRRGVKKVKSKAGSGRDAIREAVSKGIFPFPGDGHRFGDAEGYEEIEDWLCVESCPIRMLDGQSGDRKAGGAVMEGEHSDIGYHGRMTHRDGWEGYADIGGASRFFYVAKASREERERGLRGAGKYMDEGREPGSPGGSNPRNRGAQQRVRNFHPTVKPIQLMRYLIRLVTPPGGLVLDPFVGSGTTLVAARLENMNAIGIEKDEEMEPIIKGRLSHIPPPLESFGRPNKELAD